MKKLRLSKPGFSLIEIVFVLAISGFIIALVFLVLPQAKITAHDATRKAYLVRVAANVDKFKDSQANHFQYPDTSGNPTTGFVANFQLTTPVGPYAVTTNDIDSKTGTVYNMTAQSPAPGLIATGTIVYSAEYLCNGNNPGVNAYSLTIGLENNNKYCLDNH